MVVVLPAPAGPTNFTVGIVAQPVLEKLTVVV